MSEEQQIATVNLAMSYKSGHYGAMPCHPAISLTIATSPSQSIQKVYQGHVIYPNSHQTK